MKLSKTNRRLMAALLCGALILGSGTLPTKVDAASSSEIQGQIDELQRKSDEFDAQLSELAVVSESLSPSFDSNVYSYTVTASGTNAKVEATATQPGAQVAVAYNGKNVRNGGTVTWTADGKAYPLTVTVTQGNAVRVYTVNVTKAAAG